MWNRQLHSFSIALIALFLAVLPARAQEGTLRGNVTDTTGAPIADADVAVVSIHLLTRTDAKGHFTFSKVPRGAYEITIRRFGFKPTTISGVVGDLEYSYDVTLTSQVAELEGVRVDASETKLRLGIEDFYRRRARGAGGVFVTRAEIMARDARKPTDMLRNSPGLRVVNSRSGSGVRFTSKRNCTPSLWLDGQEVREMELDNIPVSDIEGMELYAGPATTPMQFSHGWSRNDCGTVVVWTRIPGSA